MNVFDRVLVPLDGSEHAEAILGRLRRILARRTNSELVLFQAIPAAPGMRAEAYSRLAGSDAGTAGVYLSRKARDLGVWSAGVRTCVFRGEAAAAIVQAAREEEATSIAMTTHGRSGVARWALGSVAERVLRRAHHPVLIARSLISKAEPIAGSRTPPWPMRVLAPTDGSAAAHLALPLVEEVAKSLDAEVVVLHVQPVVVPAGVGGSTLTGPWVVPSAAGAAAAESVHVAEEVASRLRQSGVPARGESIPGDPAQVILDQARGLDADLIVMSTHGRTGPGRWLFGSVTERVMRNCEAPLLVIRRAEAAQGES